MVSGRTRFVPSRAKRSSVTFAADTPGASTNLKCDLSNTENSLRYWVQLRSINVLLVSMWKTYLCEYSPIFDNVLHSPLGRSIHQRGVSL